MTKPDVEFATALPGFTLLALTCLAAVPRALAAAGAPPLEANRVVEITFEAGKRWPEPFIEVTLDVTFTDPVGERKTVPAFWAGGDRWKVRYASPIVGTHGYRTRCSESDDSGLHGVEGRIEITPSAGENPLYCHGPVRVVKDRRHFEHADGTPFFWLGETWWKGLCGRISWEGFQQLTADRKVKGFTALQIVAGPYPDEPPFDPRWANEGGMPYEKGYTRVNPAYFDQADRRIEHLVEAGIVPAIVGGWGWHMPSVGVEKMSRHWRYLVGRYGAYPVV